MIDDPSEFDKIIEKINVKPKKGLSKRSYYYSIAASIAFFIIVSTSALYFLGTFDRTQKIEWNEKITKLGQKSILTLFKCF